jgi:nucleoside-diphosphate-sugar epimerase
LGAVGGEESAMNGETHTHDVSSSTPSLPDRIESVDQLEELLGLPTPEVIDTMRRLDGDLIVLGVGGKIGPSLARMARRASDLAGVPRRILGVARFSSPDLRKSLQSHSIETIACDLLDRSALNALPDVPNVLYLAAMKFGSTGQEATTWAMNCYLPGMVCEKYRSSRIVAYSTGNVYAMAPPSSGGPDEDGTIAPVGDYAMSCLGRERIFSHFSRTLGIPVALLRLNYAHEMRYGVMVDLAQQVLAGRTIDVTMGHFNAIWQGDSNAMTLRALDHTASPPRAVNIAGPDTLSVRRVAERFGELLGKPVTLSGSEAPDALLSNGRLGHELLGHPRVTVEQMIAWIADWQLRGGPLLGKPTHFQTRDGKF